jgi:hypothetical protein
MADLQIAGDWACLSSVTAYARANIAKKRSVLEGKVIDIRNKTGGSQAEDSKSNK